jgi:hypothetical protein
MARTTDYAEMRNWAKAAATSRGRFITEEAERGAEDRL